MNSLLGKRWVAIFAVPNEVFEWYRGKGAGGGELGLIQME